MTRSHNLDEIKLLTFKITEPICESHLTRQFCQHLVRLVVNPFRGEDLEEKSLRLFWRKHTNLDGDLNALWHQEDQHLDHWEDFVLEPGTPSRPVRYAACIFQKGWISGERKTQSGFWPPLVLANYGLWCEFVRNFMTKISIHNTINLQWIFDLVKLPFGDIAQPHPHDLTLRIDCSNAGAILWSFSSDTSITMLVILLL